MPNTESIGDRLRRLREAAGLTQAELADAAGVARPSVNEIETGVTAKPRRGTLSKLAAKLGVSVDALQGSDGRALSPAPVAAAVAPVAGLPLSQREPIPPGQLATTIDFSARLIAMQDKAMADKDKALADKDAFIDELLRTIEDLRADKAELRKKPEGNRFAATGSSASHLVMRRFGSEASRRLRTLRKQVRHEWRQQRERQRVGFVTMQVVREAA